MNLGEILFGAVLLGLGAQQMKKGAERLGKGLRGAGGARVEKDTKRRLPKRVGVVRRGGMTMDLREVRSLDDRINAIRDRIRKGKVDPKILAWARKQVTRKCGADWCIKEKDTAAEIVAIFEGMRRDVRYTSDVAGVDTYANPRRTLEHRAGDCDDYSALGCAALMSIGIPCRLKVIRTKDSSTWNHIYIEAGSPKDRPSRWIPLDASVNVRAGWEAPRSMVAETRIFEVSPYL
ncbi:MAG: transglutaminase domain-containing protein [Acidobacteria bacterium]|nr:transglutaminase domain-containing protein [Acidobacteriota bacterium]